MQTGNPACDILVKQAVAAERERCAKIAEAAEDNSERASCPYDGGAGSLGYAQACREVAEAIRNIKSE